MNFWQRFRPLSSGKILIYFAAIVTIIAYFFPQRQGGGVEQKATVEQSPGTTVLQSGRDINIHPPAASTSQPVIPKLQVKPIDIIERIDIIMIKIAVLNFSEYVARNIFIDIKVGDCAWSQEVWKASGKDTTLFKFDPDDEEIKKYRENYHNRPILNELEPRKATTVRMWDKKKEFWLNKKISWSNPDGERPLTPNETKAYQQSFLGWKEEIEKTCSGHPIIIKVRTVFENKIGKIFDRIIEYELNCTEVGTGRSYTFEPTGISMEDI